MSEVSKFLVSVSVPELHNIPVQPSSMTFAIGFIYSFFMFVSTLRGLLYKYLLAIHDVQTLRQALLALTVEVVYNGLATRSV